jgi:hypothetical protein
MQWNTPVSVCADDVNILRDILNSTKENTEAQIDTCEEDGLEVNAERTNTSCCVVTRIQGKIMTSSV